LEPNPIGWKDHLIESSVNGRGLSRQNDHIGPLCIETKFQYGPQASRCRQPAGLKQIAGFECVEVSTGLPLKKLTCSAAVQPQPGDLGVPKQLAHAGVKAAISDSL
jgi:hypothetical protein